MTRAVLVDETAVDEAEAQALYYAEHAGVEIALRFAAEIEAIYRGLAEQRFVGVNHPRVRFRSQIKRVFLDRFPFAVVFFVDGDTVHVIALEALVKKPGYWRLRSR